MEEEVLGLPEDFKDARGESDVPIKGERLGANK